MRTRYLNAGLMAIGLLVGLGIAWGGLSLSPRKMLPVAQAPIEPAAPQPTGPITGSPVPTPTTGKSAELEALKNALGSVKEQHGDTQAEMQQQRESFAMLHQRLGQLFEAQRALTQEVDHLSQQAADDADTDSETAPNPAEQSEQMTERIIEEHEAEAVDTEWRAQAEDSIEASFYRQDLSDLVLLGAECRSTVCRIEVAYDGDMPSPESKAQLPYIVPWDTDGLLVYDEANRTMVLYAAREGMALDQVR